MKHGLNSATVDRIRSVLARFSETFQIEADDEHQREVEDDDRQINARKVN